MTIVNKVILTNRSAMQHKYGGTWVLIQSAVDALIAKDLTRGLSSRLILLDDHVAMTGLGGIGVLSSASPQQNLAAVNAVRAALSPTHVMLLGSIDVIPYQNLTNPLHVPGNIENDPDPITWSDLPYACGQPYSQNIDHFLTPSISVSRLPDVTHGTDAGYLVGLLNIATDYTCRPRSAYEPYMGLTKRNWSNSTKLILTAAFGNATQIHEIPPESSPWPLTLLQNLSHFINCEGITYASQFYATGIVVLDAEELDRHVAQGTVVAAECCYGTELYDPAIALGKFSVCNTYLANGAYGFLGSSTVAYSEASVNDFADLICKYFLNHLLAGATLGEALLEARREYIAINSPLSDKDLKTLAQFTLLGDPSLRPVCLEKEGTAMEFIGRVVERIFAKGTKSERLAIMLITEGHEYILRRQGVPPFHDPELEKLVDKKVRCKGIVYGYTLFITKATIIDSDE